MLISLRRQRGVSLIELMIGIVLIAVLLVTGLPSLSAWLQNRQIRTAADAVLNGLQLARAEAVRRNHNVEFVLGDGAAWRVGCTPADGTNCPASIQERIAGEGTGNATLSLSDTTGTLVFTPFGKVTTATLAAGETAIFAIGSSRDTCVADGGSMRCLEVRVSPGGQIRMCDPYLTTTFPNDARAC